MNVAAAILILGACGSASRTMTVDASIEQIVVRVVAGGMNDATGRLRPMREMRWREIQTTLQRIREMQIVLRIDGTERTGVFAWTAAAARVAGYAVSRPKDREQVASVRGGTGSVEYSYRLRVRGLDIIRRTWIENRRISLVTDVYGSIADGKLNHVRLVLVAVETADGTRITGLATGDSAIGDHCRLVRRIAERAIADGLDRELLARIQRGGIDLYRAGAIVEAMK